MKDQYFGDINDYRKYGLLRLLTAGGQLHLGICWMLTELDGSTDGRRLAYLRQPEKCRHHDPQLFDWLCSTTLRGSDRRVAHIESSGLLATATFQSKILTDSKEQRHTYFRDGESQFTGCDLVFFDPDNGLEINSVRRGNKSSCKYLYWDEVCATFRSGASVLIYQHFPRKPRGVFVAALAESLSRRVTAAAVFAFETRDVVFLLASQHQHLRHFERQNEKINLAWRPEMSGRRCDPQPPHVAD